MEGEGLNRLQLRHSTKQHRSGSKQCEGGRLQLSHHLGGKRLLIKLLSGNKYLGWKCVQTKICPQSLLLKTNLV